MSLDKINSINSYLYFEEELSMCLRLENSSREELTAALVSPFPLERWYASFCLQKLLAKEVDNA